MQATGGDITYDNGYKIHTFTGDGTLNVLSAGDVEVLVVAGGGGGGTWCGGGGGGGGVVHQSVHALVTKPYAITVGAGAPRATADGPGANGSNSVFDDITADGGGGGGAYPTETGQNGGSGGGGAHGNTAEGGTGVTDQGYDGGKGSTNDSSGGGGGAGEIGHDAVTTTGGTGGVGIACDISGTTKYYGGGGGGWGYSAIGVADVNGGGGDGSNQVNGEIAEDGETNTGGGGGGGWYHSFSSHGGGGGSGIVIIRYLYTGEVIVPDHLHTAALLSGVPAVILSAGDMAVTVDLTVANIFIGTSIQADPLAVNPDLTPQICLHLVAPELAAQAALSAVVEQVFNIVPATLAALAVLAVSGVAQFIDDDYNITYTCSLKPIAGSGYADLILPISSFQGRFRSGDPSFLSVVVPGMDYSADIAARSTGDIAVYMVKTYRDGNRISEEIMTVDLEDIRIDEGGINQSISLSGHRTTTYSSQEVTLAGTSYKNVLNGKNRYRCSPHLYLRPGNTVTIDGETFTADEINWAMSVESQTMEVAEA